MRYAGEKVLTRLAITHTLAMQSLAGDDHVIDISNTRSTF